MFQSFVEGLGRNLTINFLSHSGTDESEMMSG